jgi:hypothetical protein
VITLVYGLNLCFLLNERSFVMDDPIESLAKEIEGNIGFLEDLVTRNNLILGTAGIVVILTVIVLLFR